MKEQFHIQWNINNLCNLHCKHCYQDDFSKKSDLDWSGLKRISNNLLATLEEWDRTACIHLTGGEPLLKPELFILLNDLDQRSGVEELGIITNGLLIDQEMTKRLSRFSKLRKIKISLDGGNAETNDTIRQKGAFEKVMQNLPFLKETGGFEILFMITIMKSNFRSLPSLFRLCQDLGVNGLIIERFIPLGRGKEIIGEVLSKEEWKEMTGMLLDFFPTDEEEYPFLPYQAFQVNFSGEEPELFGAPCVVGVDGLCVMPEGTVFPCRRFPVSLGNLVNESLRQIWEKSELLEKLRRKENLKGKCGRCDLKECRGCRSLAFALTGNDLEEDPHCWYVPD
jgi:radical SAM protein with 4Fe4S-binding SPASM domain